MPTEELFDTTLSNIEKTLPENFKLSNEKIKAILKILLGEGINNLSEEQFQGMIEMLTKKIGDLTIVIAATISGLPLPSEFLPETPSDEKNLMNILSENIISINKEE